jgi:CheY-like chemotaxis protein
VRDIIDRQVQQLTHLIDDLLDVSRITRGKIQLRPERLDLSAVAPLAVETARPLLELRGHQLTLRLAPQLLWVDADRVRLEQIMTNLLTNAAKYTEPGGQIWLTTASEGSDAVLRVKDTGIGIAPEMQPRIFELFMQAEPTLDRSQGGLGIGLTLVKRLVELHGGRIEVASQGLGQGSEFTVRLPLRAPAEPSETACPEVPRAGERLVQRILVVDDNHDGAESLALLLRLWGHEVRLANDGPSALRMIEASLPDVVLCDIGLPGMDGYQLAKQLRQQGPNCLRLFALTGYGQDEDRRRSRAAGFDGHLVKPIDPEELQQALQQA